MKDVRTIADVLAWLERLAPLSLAESWDNVGLLVGNPSRPVERVMTCLSLTSDVAAEAVRERANLVLTHHPLPFKPLSSVTTATSVGRRLLTLIENQIAVASSHTAYDSCQTGINAQWCENLGVANPRPLRLTTHTNENGAAIEVGAGRFGPTDPMSLRELIHMAAKAASAEFVDFVGNPEQKVHRVAVACGSGGDFLSDAAKQGCDALITGEASFHTCLEATEKEMGLILVGHYPSERFAMENLATRICHELPGILCWASRNERNPLRRT